MLLKDGSLNFAPSALAEFSPQMYRSYYYPISDGLLLERQWAFYGALYRHQPWVRVVVDKLANALARLSIEVWKGTGADRRLARSPYAKLIANPCNGLSPYSFWAWIATTIEIYGEAFLVKVRNAAGAVVSLIPMHPSRTSIRREIDGRRVYLFSTAASQAGLLEFAEEDVVPFQLYSPDNTMRGLSRLESLRSTLISEDSSRTATSSMWRNAGRPNMVLSSAKVLGPEGRKRLRESFDSNHAGSLNSGKTLVLEDGVKAEPVQLTAVEMQFVQSRQLNREEVCAVYDVAPPMVHILDRATFSNITAQMRAFYRDTMSVRLEFVEAQLDYYLGCEFADDLEARFAVAEVLRGDYETRAQSVQQLVLAGVMKPAEGREVMELGKAGPEADRLYAQASIQPLGQPAERITLTGDVAPGGDPDGVATTDPADTAPNPSASAPRPQKSSRYVRAIRGGMGRGQSLEQAAVALADKHPADRHEILAAARFLLAV
ncbi:phage portal protein [Nocardia brasiliensis]|uniref:Phage portal protein n=1 Tax=Nocardia brasiliensis TaxID=37326 RepID=A0A6G9Y0N2_NOCBR|nr:phage portal protein [Nocardia brasiliensis]QIS06765.1 phage portal protein [Nocardia brasiliensis]